MIRAVYKRPAVELDLFECFLFIGRDSETSARLFLKEANAAFAKIAAMPGVGSKFEAIDPRLQHIRQTAVSRRFRNYLIFYRVQADFIEILAVVHGMRDLPKLLSKKL